MHRYISLLRGINVGGHKKIPMVELRDLLSKKGFQNVKTYIQSGNVVLQSSEKKHATVASVIQAAIQGHFGFEVPVLVRTASDIETILANCPFPKTAKEKSYFMMLSEVPDMELVKIASEKVYEGEEYHIINDCLYFYCEAGYGKAKFNMNYFEKKLKVSATARNYRTMTKLLEMTTS